MRALICAAVLIWAGNVYAQAPLAKVKVVATFSVIGDLVKNVVGPDADVFILVGPDGDVHTYEPSPKDNVLLMQAAIIFENGLHMEPWLDKLYASSASQARRVVLTEDIEAIFLNEGGRTDADPHVWHDVANVMIMVEHIRDSLIQADQAHAQVYAKNAETYLVRLATLDHWIIDSLKDIPDEKRKLVTSHDTFGYFAKRYDFKIVGTAIESATTEAADPAASQIARLIDAIKASGVTVVFAENIHNPKLLQSIAAEAGVQLVPYLFTDALGNPGTDGDTYIKMMQHNAQVLARNLK